MTNLIGLVDKKLDTTCLKNYTQENHFFDLSIFHKVDQLYEALAGQSSGILFISESKGYDLFKICSYISVNFPRTVIVLLVENEDLEIKKAMYAGATDVVYLPLENAQLVETMENALNLLEIREINANGGAKPSLNGKVLTICSAKGGVGKTTISANLAGALVNKQNKVAIIDLDLQFGDVGIMFDIKPKRTIYDWIKQSNEEDKGNIADFMTKHQSGVSILPAPLRPEFAEEVTGEHIEQLIEEMKKEFNYIIIDTPPGLVETSLVGLEKSQDIILVTYTDITSVKGSKVFVETLNSLGVKDQLKLVINRYTKGMGITPAEAESILETPVSLILPSNEKVVVNSINTGVPFSFSNPASNISKKMHSFSTTLTESNKTGQKKGLFSRLSLISKEA